tara:strand:- start:32 stop:919 length:888 start_codon:yes stop_codon:yes gene_type:complete
MIKKRGGLGKGLSAILGNRSSDIKKDENFLGNKNEILIEEIIANPFQPRNKFDSNKLDELSISIRQLGVIQPITVRMISSNQYQIISGERRYRASQMAGKKSIPAFVRIANDQQMLEMALVENIQRENLNPIEIALSYQRLINECDLTHELCSNRVGKKRTTVTNFLRLLKLPGKIQKGLINNKISTGHARALVNITNKENQLNIYHDTIANGYSVREVEQIAKTFNNKSYKRTSKEIKESIYTFQHKKIIYDLSKKINIDVQIKINKNGSGKIIIPFNNSTDIERISDNLKNKS